MGGSAEGGLVERVACYSAADSYSQYCCFDSDCCSDSYWSNSDCCSDSDSSCCSAASARNAGGYSLWRCSSEPHLMNCFPQQKTRAGFLVISPGPLSPVPGRWVDYGWISLVASRLLAVASWRTIESG